MVNERSSDLGREIIARSGPVNAPPSKVTAHITVGNFIDARGNFFVKIPNPALGIYPMQNASGRQELCENN